MPHVASVVVSDTAANVLSNLAVLQSQAAAGKQTSIVLTDGAPPTLTMTAAQLTPNTAALGKIASACNLIVSGVLAATVALVASQKHVSSIMVSDTATNVVANLADLQTQATAGKLASVVLTNGTTPTLILTAAQVAADAMALGMIACVYNLTVSDTAANVVANLSALQAQAATGKLTSIVLTDALTPTLALTEAQLAADATRLARLQAHITY